MALLAGAGGFFAGVRYQQSKTPSFLNRLAGNGQTARGQFAQRAGTQGLKPVSGTIISQNGVFCS